MTTKLSVAELRDKVRGCLIGTAVGDALGMPCEMMTRTDRESRLGRITGFLESASKYSRGLTRGQWTDDTRLSIATAQGLIDALAMGGQKTSLVMVIDAIQRRYIEAYREHRDRGFGKSTRNALEDHIAGKNPHDGRNPVRPGNGCAMKGAILGVYSALSVVYPTAPFFSLGNLSGGVAWITHQDARSLTAGFIQASAAENYLISPLIEDRYLMKYLCTEALQYENTHPDLPGDIPSISEVLQRIPSVYGASDELIADTLKTGGAAYESFPTALAYAIKYKDDFRSAVLAGSNAGGDTDTIAAMTGALVGTRLGMSAIPTEWREGLEACEHIISVADELIDTVFRIATSENTKNGL